MSTSGQKKEIYRYKPSFPTYGLNWSPDPRFPTRLALGSFLEDHTNKIQIVQANYEDDSVQVVASVDHAYPATKVMFQPLNNSETSLLATTADFLRLWEVKDSQIQLKALLNNNKTSEYCAPVTSFDWNEVSPNILGTSSIDTTCTIWDIETQQAKTQLIAHDKEVYDMAFAKNSDHLFGSVGADGSVRMFDLRSLEHSTILYESPDFKPLLRLGWDVLDQNYLACIVLGGSSIVILDVRAPSTPVTELSGHQAPINSLVWNPHSSFHLCSGSDDGKVIIWDLSSQQPAVLFYDAQSPVNQLGWSPLDPNRIGIAIEDEVQILKV